MSAHDWVLERAAEPGDSTEAEVHMCRRCGVFRDSEWGTLPVFRRQLPMRAGRLVSHTRLDGDPGCP